MSAKAKDPIVRINDLSGDGTGPWRLTVNGFGVCQWPVGDLAETCPEQYAGEAARVLRVALSADLARPRAAKQANRKGAKGR